MKSLENHLCTVKVYAKSGYHHHACKIVSISHLVQSHLVAVELALRLLRYALCTVLRGTSKNLRIFVEPRLTLCILVAAGKSLLAINAAGGVGGLACCSGVGRVGFAAAHEVVDEGVGVLAGAFGGFLWVLLVSRWSKVVHGRDQVAYTALVQGTFQLVGCVFS
jgi:hypothetical protein